jgi:hypothetical protein
MIVLRSAFPVTIRRAVLAGLLAAGTPSHAADLVAIQIIVANETREALECQALAGHWFSFDLGGNAPQSHLTIDMSFDAATGTVVMYNSLKEALPIETVYCGYRGRAWETRFDFPLRALAAQAARNGQVTLVCRSADAAPACS